MPEFIEHESEKSEFTHTLDQVAHILAPVVLRSGEELRAVIDKVRKRVEYAVERGDLRTEGVPGMRFYCLPQVIAWARRKWPGKFPELTAEHEAKVQSRVGIGDRLGSCTYPADLDRSHDALKKAYGQIKELTVALKAAYAEIDLLRPLAEKYEQNREKNRKSAKLPRGGQS
jgi:hypothetical protein